MLAILQTIAELTLFHHKVWQSQLFASSGIFCAVFASAGWFFALSTCCNYSNYCTSTRRQSHANRGGVRDGRHFGANDASLSKSAATSNLAPFIYFSSRDAVRCRFLSLIASTNRNLSRGCIYTFMYLWSEFQSQWPIGCVCTLLCTNMHTVSKEDFILMQILIESCQRISRTFWCRAKDFSSGNIFH